jgi:hypothetical protein
MGHKSDDDESDEDVDGDLLTREELARKFFCLDKSDLLEYLSAQQHLNLLLQQSIYIKYQCFCF